MQRLNKISVVFEHEDGYRWEQVYSSKAAFKRAISNVKNGTWLHATDFTAGVAIYPSNVWGYLRT